MRIAIAHDYLTQRGGAERVVLAMSRAFPDAPIYTTLYDPDGTFPEFRDRTIVTSPLNRIGMLRRDHRRALPLLPFAAATVRPDADLVLCSSSGWAHGFAGDYRRLVYCYSPARWLYCTEDYLGGKVTESAQGLALAALRRPLMAWDRRKAAQADRYLAISTVIADRIRAAYGIDAPVVPSPNTIDPDGNREPVAELDDWTDDGWALVVSRLLPYKHVLETVRAFDGLTGKRLVVVGRGPQDAEIRAALPSNARLCQGLTDAQIRWVYAHSSFLIAPSFEDFGLTPLEAGAFGKPTLALRAGGYLDTLSEGITGAFFDSATEAGIREAVCAFDPSRYSPDAVASWVSRFSEEAFAERLHAEVEALTRGR